MRPPTLRTFFVVVAAFVAGRAQAEAKRGARKPAQVTAPATSAQTPVSPAQTGAPAAKAATPVASKPGAPAPAPAPSLAPGLDSIAPVSTIGSAFLVDDESKRISFDSLRIWKDARWYAIGHWEGPNLIRWLGGKETSYAMPKPECSLPEAYPSFVRPENFEEKRVDGQKKSLNREVMHKREWFAIELNPAIESENFEIRSPRFKEMPECRTEVRFNYGWQKPTALKPLLFLKTKDYFFGHEITIYAPEKPQKANIQLDLFIGLWKGTFPSAKVNPNFASANKPAPKTSLLFIPTAVSRGEWILPGQKRFGLMLALEQTLFSMGGQPSQTVRISDWFTGVFYQQMMPAIDGLQFRMAMRYHEHLTDQGTVYDTQIDANRNAKNIIVTGTLNHYLARRWLLGVDFEYGFPNGLAGRGVKQGYIGYYGRLGFRLTNFMLILSEFGFRNYSAAGYPTEKLLQANGGIRLEL